MKRRTFLKALAIASISPSLVPLDAVSLKTKRERPKGDKLIKKERMPLSNVGVSDDDYLDGSEETLQYAHNLYSLDDKGNATFLKTLTDLEYRKLSKILCKIF